MGHTLPAALLLIPNQPHLPLVPLYTYIAFPLLMPFVARCYVFARSSFSDGASLAGPGYIPLQLTYFSAFLTAAVARVHLVVIPGLASVSASAPTAFPLLNKLANLAGYIVSFTFPSTLHTPTASETTAASGIIHFVQWNSLVVFAAVWVALLWDMSLRDARMADRQPAGKAGGWQGAVKAVAALCGASFVLGPGAATAALFILREAQMERLRVAMKRWE